MALHVFQTYTFCQINIILNYDFSIYAHGNINMQYLVFQWPYC